MYFMNVSVLSIRKCTLLQIIFINKLHNFSNLAHKLNLRKTLDIIKMNISRFTSQQLYHFSILSINFYEMRIIIGVKHILVNKRNVMKLENIFYLLP